MVSKTEICSLASLSVGGSTFTDLDQNLKEARACKACYDSRRQNLLRKHPWNFATRRAQPASQVTSPSFEYDYQFPLPSNCLRVLKVYSQSGDYKIEGRNILYNDATIDVIYIEDIEDTDQFDPLFATALSDDIAAFIAITITGNATIAAGLADKAQKSLNEARRVDAQEGSPEQFYDFDWIDGRL